MKTRQLRSIELRTVKREVKCQRIPFLGAGGPLQAFLALSDIYTYFFSEIKKSFSRLNTKQNQ